MTLEILILTWWAHKCCGVKLINGIPTVHYNFWNDIDVLEDVGIYRAQFFYWCFKAVLNLTVKGGYLMLKISFILVKFEMAYKQTTKLMHATNVFP